MEEAISILRVLRIIRIRKFVSREWSSPMGRELCTSDVLQYCESILPVFQTWLTLRLKKSKKKIYLFPVVKPVLSGPVVSGHPLLSGQLSKSRKLLPLITVILTSIKRSPLLSGRGHPLLSPDELFLLSWPLVNGHFVKGNHSNTTVVHTITNIAHQVIDFPVYFPANIQWKSLEREDKYDVELKQPTL